MRWLLPLTGSPLILIETALSMLASCALLVWPCLREGKRAMVRGAAYLAACAVLVDIDLWVMLHPTFGLLRHGGLRNGYLLVLSMHAVVWLAYAVARRAVCRLK